MALKLRTAEPADTRPALVKEIDALSDKLEARLEQIVAEEALECEGIPAPVLRHTLLKGSSNFFAAMRALLIERANGTTG